ncbi:hypothetical protein DPM19_15290 [Actinomadura craniellae]|uniref:Uncharacterized protein n=1 Tax=Actinomadura craniellae TaxID=2231787 RepID=A0A365H5Q3_9ACTN|nr:hypothetical protein [Actinomadura craniellae]RAY14332.1 hypothetical protein DPM19_15290 [Actinomadura craniellae]
MIRTTLKVAAGALAALVTLAGCGGSPIKVGAAATVGDERITTSSLGQVVDDWQREFRADPAAGQMRARFEASGQQIVVDSRSPARTALAQLLDFRVADRVAARYGAQPAPAEVELVSRQLGGPRTLTSLTLAIGLPARYQDDLLHSLAVQNTLLTRLGAVPVPRTPADETQTRQAARRANEIYRQARTGLDIQINPRYGQWRSDEGLSPVTTALSRPGVVPVTGPVVPDLG